MERQEKFTAVHFALLALTLAFLGALFWAAGQERFTAPADEYRVAAERSVPAEAAAPESLRIDVNAASEEELETLPGIGPALARAIVEYREEHGPFTSADGLLEVSGIGKAKLDNIRDDITLGEGEAS